MTSPDTRLPNPFETPDRADEFATRYPEQVRALLATLRLSHLGGIFIAECDDLELRKKLFSYFRKRLTDENIYLYYFEVSDTDLNLVRTLRNLTDQPGFKNLELVGRYKHIVLFIYGLEKYDAEQRARFLHLLNFLRDAFTLIEQPVVIWAQSEFVTQFARQAPDFWNWKGAIFTFASPPASPAEAADSELLLRAKLPPLPRYLHDILDDPEFFTWRDLYLPLQARRATEPTKQAFVRQPLSPDQLRVLAAYCPPREFVADEVLIQAGEPGDVAYVITGGNLEVILTDDRDAEIFSGQVTQGDVIGEIALLSEQPRTATVRALSAGQALVVDRDRFAKLEANEPILASFFRDLARKRLESLQQFSSPLRWFAVESYELFRQPPQDVMTILANEPRVALLGEAGAGKTTVLRRFMLDLAERAQADLANPEVPLRVPIYVKLSLLDGQRTVEELIWNSLYHYGIYQVDDPDRVFAFLSDSGGAARAQPPRFVFLLDGLNEMPDDANARHTLRQFRHRFFDHQFVIACRTQDYIPIQGYQVAILQRLTGDDVEAFLRRYLPAEKAHAVLREIYADAQLLELGQSPLALYMFTQIASDSREALPKNRGVLFQRFTDNLLERTDTEWYRIFGRSKSQVPLAVRQRALAELGLWMQEEGVQTLPRDHCLTIFHDAVAGSPPVIQGESGEPAHIAAQDIFAECIHSGLIRLSPDRSRVEFFHQAVQEYFIAQGLLLRGAGVEPYLADLDQRRRWESVIVLYFSIAPDKPRILRALLRDDRDYYNILLAAECLTSVGMAPSILNQIRRSLEAPEVGPFLFAQGLAYRRLGRFPEALTRLHEAIKLDPDSVYVHYDMGCLYRQMDQYGRAIQALEEALKIDPFFVDAYNQLGLTYYVQEQYVEALTVFQTTVQLEPDNAFHYYNLGHVHKVLRLYQEAAGDFQRAVELKPDYEEAQAQLDMLQKALTTGALDVLEKIPLLSKLTLEQFVMISSRLQVRECAPGEIIFSRGEIGETFFIIESGQVEVLAPHPSGQDRVINALSAGDFFGEIALLRATPRTATVVSRNHTRLLTLSRADFNAITHYPAIADSLEETSSRRLLQDRRRGGRESVERRYDTHYLEELIQQVEVTALVSDIHGSTALTQAIGPELMMVFLDEFLLELTSAIVEYNGAVGKSLGDSVMGVFGSTPAHDEVSPSYGVRAVLAALEMRRTFLKLRKRWQRLYPQHRDAFTASGLGIGVCTGKMALGTVGMEQTMVGEPVNVAAHLSKFIRHSREECDVYIDQRTCSLTSNAFEVEGISLTDSRDFASSTVIYRVNEHS